MKQVTNIIKQIRYRRLLKRSFEPREEFMNRSRELFLAEVAKRQKVPVAVPAMRYAFGVHAFRYAAAFAAVALIGTSSLVAYADNTNVSVESPLYPLKRVGEQVRLTVVPAAKAPELHKEFAQRRAHELLEIESTQRSRGQDDVVRPSGSDDREQRLRADFRKSIESIEDTRERGNDRSMGTIIDPSLCKVAQEVDRHGNSGKSDRYRKFEDRCNDLLKEDERGRNNDRLSDDDPARSLDDRDRSGSVEQGDDRGGDRGRSNDDNGSVRRDDATDNGRGSDDHQRNGDAGDQSDDGGRDRGKGETDDRKDDRRARD